MFAGSACTLVAEEILEDKHREQILDSGVAHLLTGTILIDTVNLSPSAGRTTEKDIRVISQMSEVFPDIDREGLVKKLQFEKLNIMSLSTRDLLRKDYKEWGGLDGGEGKVVQMGISSVGLALHKWLAKDAQMFDGLSQWAKERGNNILLCMHAFVDDEGKFTRELTVFNDNDEGLFTRFVDFLAEKPGQEWQLTPVAIDSLGTGASLPPAAKVCFYHQANLKVSRKILSPVIIRDFFHSQDLAGEP